jgi:hypothetical protein
MDSPLLVASELATRGSVMAKAKRMFPLQQRFQPLPLLRIGAEFVEYLQFPVSMAAQLNTAGGAFWRLVRAAPLLPGRNRFHSRR